MLQTFNNFNYTEKIMTDKLKEIEKQIADLQKQKQAILDADRDNALKQIKALIKEYGFSPSELRTAKEKSEPKYANPDDATQTWTGKGIKPGWIKAHIESGKNIDELLIKK